MHGVQGHSGFSLRLLAISFAVFLFAFSPNLQAAVFDVASGDVDGLKRALGEASSGDTINLAPGIYSLTDAPLYVANTIEIVGTAAIIERADSAPPFRILFVGMTGNLTLTGVTIRNGDSTGTTDDGGGILNEGMLVVRNCVVSDSTAGLRDGGGIFNAATGTLTVVDSLIANNFASDEGGGIANRGTLTVRRSGLSNNTSTNGGAIANRGSALIAQSTLGKNTGDNGGAILNDGGLLTINRSTLSENRYEFGGGILNRGSLTLRNSTISGNTPGFSSGGVGGGIFNRGVATIRSSTIANNVKNFPDGEGAGIFNSGGIVDLRNTLIARNTDTRGDPGDDCAGDPVVTRGFNLDSDGTCNLNARGDLSGVEPFLEPLASNGGLTRTHALLYDIFIPAISPAIDAGSPRGCPSVDQRGVARPADGDLDGVPVCDIGAYELVP